MKLKKVSANEVFRELILGQMETESIKNNLDRIEEMSKDEKLEAARIKKFPATYEELFEDKDIKWFKTELSPETDFINKIFDGKGFMQPLGVKHSDFARQYNSGKMSLDHKKSIDKIRKSLFERPRVIVLTKDLREFVIYDGGHRALAFILEEKNIPVYLGKKSSFKCFKI
jgi:hypothetical protein